MKSNGAAAASLAIALLLLCVCVRAETRTHSNHLRPTFVAGRHSQPLIEDACVRSSTMRELVRQLQHSDVIAWVVVAGPNSDARRTVNQLALQASISGGSGWLQFAGTAGGSRFVRITVDAASRDDAIVWLAHELQHAVELARHPEVRGDATLLRLFGRLGWRSDNRSSVFETDAAEQVAAQVFHDITRYASDDRAVRSSLEAAGRTAGCFDAWGESR